jgi:catalase
MSKYTRADLFNTIGKKSPVFTRFSTVGGEKGSADTERDPRGFSVKFYTEEGNYDIVGNNTPVFFIRDPIKFPEFIHTQKRCPHNNRKSANMAWDFWTKHTESAHQVMILFSNRGTPDGYRFMNGYGSHTFKWVNADGESFLIKYHWVCDQGCKNLTADAAHQLKADNPDYATDDLYDAIENGDFPSWTLKVQIMPEADGEKYHWDVLDITKVWPHGDYPLIEVGKMTLDRNPTNYHCETEQVAYSPSHFVPGVEASNDKMLQGRLFSYPDTHRHRLGPNYQNIAINCPYRVKQRDYTLAGPFAVDIEGVDKQIYQGKFNEAPKERPEVETKKFAVHGEAGRYDFAHVNSDFAQPAGLYNAVFDDDEKSNLVENLAMHIKGCKSHVITAAVEMWTKVDENLGKKLGMKLKTLGCESC